MAFSFAGKWRGVLFVLLVVIIVSCIFIAYRTIYGPLSGYDPVLEQRFEALEQKVEQKIGDLAKQVQKGAETATGKGVEHAKTILDEPDDRWLDVVNDWSQRMLEYAGGETTE